MLITGTSFPAILGFSPFMSKYMAQQRLLGLLKTEDNPAMELGRTMEAVLIEEYEEKFNEKIQTFQSIGEDYEAWEPHFTRDVFGAHLDGAIVGEDGKIERIIEVKCTSKAEAWVKDGELDIPQNYYLQASLYAWITRAEKITFIVGLVEPSAYANPSEIQDHEILAIDTVPLHVECPEMMDSYLDTCKKFLENIENGVLLKPDLSDERDRKTIRQDRKCPDVIGGWEEKIQELSIIDLHLARLNEARSKIVDDMKAKMDDLVPDGGKIEIKGIDVNYSYRKDFRQKIDYKKACDDAHIDLAPYTTQSVTKILSEISSKKAKNKED